MSLNDYAIVTIDNVKEYNDMKGAQALTDEFMEQVIYEMTLVFESYTDRKFISREFTEYHNGNGTKHLFPDNYPITSVSGVWSSTAWAWDSTTLISSSDYAIRDDKIITLKNLVFPEYDNGNIKIIYTAGWTRANVPADLKLACIEEVVRVEKNRKGVDVLAKTAPDGSVTRYTKDLMPSTLRILNSYRKMRVR